MINSLQFELQNNFSMEEASTTPILRYPQSAFDTIVEKSPIEKYKSIQSERAIVKSNEFNNRNQSILKKNSPNQWLSPSSPDSTIKSINHKNDNFNSSKDLLWTSTQSSPNSTQHEQLTGQYKKSSSTPANLWESPNMRIPHATLLIQNDSPQSVWYTPPQIQSPAISSGRNIWDSPSSSVLNNAIERLSPDSTTFLRPQDLSPSDNWYNCNKSHSSNVYNTFNTNNPIWSATSPVGTNAENNIFSSTPFKSKILDTKKSCNKKITKQIAITSDQNLNQASSSCLQLFSDDFVNYLNMIN